MAFGYPHRKGLVVAVPWSGRPVPPEIVSAYASLHPPMNYNLRYVTTMRLPIDQARTMFAEKAIEWKCKYLFMMDEDVAVPGYAMRQLIQRLEHNPKAALAAGIYVQKAKPPQPMVFRANGDGPFWQWKLGELFECESIGLGCSLIRDDSFDTIEKLLGFEDALKAHQIPIEREWIVQGGFGKEVGYNGLIHFYRHSKLPEFILAATYPVALGVYEAAKELGLRIPGDLDMISFGDSDVGRFISPSLSCVSQPTQELGTRAVQMIIDMIHRQDVRTEQHVELPTQLILRDTCVGINGSAPKPITKRARATAP